MVQLNACLAFFLHDLLSVMDRGYVFTLIRTYMKDLCARSFDFILCDPVKMLNCSSLLLKTCFYKEMFFSPRIHGEGEANEQAALWGLQIDFLRIVSSHEHFIPLNLPQVIPNPYS